MDSSNIKYSTNTERKPHQRRACIIQSCNFQTPVECHFLRNMNSKLLVLFFNMSEKNCWPINSKAISVICLMSTNIHFPLILSEARILKVRLLKLSLKDNYEGRVPQKTQWGLCGKDLEVQSEKDLFLKSTKRRTKSHPWVVTDYFNFVDISFYYYY